MNATNLISTAVIVATLAVMAWLAWPEEKAAPVLTFNLADGSQLTPQDLKGRSVLVNFWSVSCSVCLRDMPRLRDLQHSLPTEQLTVIGVAMPHDPPPAVIETVAKLEPDYAIALDVHGEISQAYGDVRVTPTTFLVDPAGNIRYSARGPLDVTRIRATLATF